MAGISFYDAYFPTIASILNSIEAVLVKAQAHAKDNGVNVDTEYLTARLHEDMKPLTFQVQILCALVEASVKKLSGSGAEAWKEDDKTFDQFLARVKHTQGLVASVKPEDVNGKEDLEWEFHLGPSAGSVKMLCRHYVTRFFFPNAFFHLQTTYAILRMKGVPLGKKDYLDAFTAQGRD